MIRAALRRFPFLVNSGYATVTAGSASLLLVLLTVAARFLTAADYGRFRYALALTTIVETIMDVGLGHVTVRAVARDKAAAGRLLGDVLGLKLVWVAVGLAILAVAAPLLRADPQVVRLCYVMGLSSALRSYLLTARGLLQGLDRFDLEAAAVVSDRALLLCAGTAVLWAGYGVLGLAVAFVASRVVMLMAVLLLLRRVIGPVVPRVDLAAWGVLQAAALPLGFFMISLNTYNYIDTVILGVMRSDAETGFYGASYSVYEGLTYAPSILAAVLTPRLSNLFVRDRVAHRSLLMRGLLASTVLGVGLGAITLWAARPILITLFGAAYEPAVAPLRILAGGAVFVFATWILHAGAISTNLDRRLLLTTAVGLAANVILNLVFIPRWGISGAAWATVVAEALTMALLFVQIHRRVGERTGNLEASQ
jgi:O-antigen/teichoic acid export membrane protein